MTRPLRLVLRLVLRPVLRLVLRRALPFGAVVALWAGPVAAQPRVLSLGGAVTETVFALGAGAALVGDDLTSQYPPEAAKLPKVGYVRALGAEGMLSLRPDLVLASADAGPPAALRQVEAAKVVVLSLSEAHTAAAAVDRVRQVGTALGRLPEAASVAAALQSDLDHAVAAIARLGGRPTVLFLLSAGRGAPMAAGRDTAADAMIRLAGGVNAVTGYTGYKPLSAEAAMLAAPDVILTTADTLAAAGGAAGLAALPGLAATPAGLAGRVVAFDALYLLGFGPRLAHAVRDLGAALHPDAVLPPVPARAWAQAAPPR